MVKTRGRNKIKKKRMGIRSVLLSSPFKKLVIYDYHIKIWLDVCLQAFLLASFHI